MSRKARSLAIVILAAGKGTRMKSDMPKVMHKLAHLPMINWVINAAESLKPKKIVVVVGPDMPELEQACKPHTTVVQQKRDGTAGAVRAALPALKGFKGDVVILLGDTPLITPKTIKSLIKARGAAGLSVLGMQLDDPTGYGRLVMGREGLLERIVEHKDASAAEKKIDIVNTGAFCVDGAQLEKWLSKVNNKNAQKEYYITDLPAIAAKDGAATAVAISDDPAQMQGCNSHVNLVALEEIAQNRLRLALLEKGVCMHHPQSVFLAHDTKIAAGVTIEPNVVFAPGVSVEKGAKIRAFSYLEEAKVGKNVSVGPYARLRPGADIGDDVRIGNFVEIKKSKIGKRSKINHLAYVGDTDMGADVNFSAGAITVNYDGFDKHKTTIGDGAMVGSNVNLVAPIKIGKGAFLAAGSTLSKDIPADALGIVRDSPRILKGWAAKFRKQKTKAKKK